MSDLGALRQAVLESLSEPSTPGNLGAVDRAVARSFEELRPEQLSFNCSEFTLTTVADQSSYSPSAADPPGASELPRGIWAILGCVLRGDNSQDVEEVTPDQFIEAETSLVVSGQSRYYTYKDRTLRLWPSPNSVDVLHGRCLEDLGTPVASYADPGGWSLSVWGVTLTASWTNRWFDYAFPLLQSRVEHFVAGEYLLDDSRAAGALGRYLAALESLRNQFGVKNQFGKVRSSIEWPT